jgi:phenylalanyl-tRNA synthetase beta subunit
VSLAVRLTFSAPDRTLTDDEVAARRARVVAALQDELQGQIRG